MENFKYVKLKTPIKTPSNPLDTLKVEIDYQKKGHNYFSDTYDSGGVYVYLTPCERGEKYTRNYIDGNQHTMGYKILLKTMCRKSQKQIDKAAELILPYANDIANLYSDRKHIEVINLISKIYGNN